MNQRSIEIFSTFLRTRGYAEQTNHIYSKVLELVSDTWNTDDPKLLYEHINSTMKALEPTLKLTTTHNLRAAARQFFLLKTGIIYKDYVYKTNRQSAYEDILNDFFIYSTEFKGLKVSSIGRYVTSLRNFFRFLEYKRYPIK